MNKARRGEIAALVTRLQAVAEEVSALVDDVTTVQDDESDYLENMPESMRYADKGGEVEERISALGDAVSALEEIDIDSIVAFLEAAAE